MTKTQLIFIFFEFQIFLHEAGNEYWLQYGLSPSKTNVVYIDTDTNDGTYGIEGNLKYSTKEEVSRKNSQCDTNATIESFTQCAFNELEDYECSSAIDRIGKYFNETNICNNLTLLLENNDLIYNHLVSTLYSSKSPTKCIKPCKTSAFDLSLKKKHENAKLLAKIFTKKYATPGRFLLLFKYSDFVIETKQEYLIMNKDGLLSAIGGFLGLFLGSSLVSVIEWIGQLFKKYM